MANEPEQVEYSEPHLREAALLLATGYKLLEGVDELEHPADALPICDAALEKFKRGRDLAGDDPLGRECRLGMAAALSLRGHQLRFDREYKQSLADLTQALRLNPQLSDDYYYRALSHLALGNEKQAREDFTAFLQRGEDEYLREKAREQLARLVPKDDVQANLTHLRNEGNRIMSAAGELFTPREDQEPQYAQAASLYNKALDLFNRALNLSPKDPLSKFGKLSALKSQAECYLQIQEYDLALDSLTQAITLQPSAELYFQRGSAYLAAGHKQLALKDFESCLQTSSNNRTLREQAEQHVAELRAVRR